MPPYEAERFRPTLYYKMVNLLHISKDKDYFVFAANRVVGAKAHDKPIGEDLVDEFVGSVGKGKIKTLILDRTFLDGKMISRFKKSYGVDTLIPLKKNMDAALDAKGLARLDKAPWKKAVP